MKHKKIFLISTLVFAFVFIAAKNFSNPLKKQDWDTDTYVYKALALLGDTKPVFFIEDVDPGMITKGYDLVHYGRTVSPNGGKSKYISLYYVCTNCHNTVIEDPILTDFDPQARLEFAVANNLPFLQGTTFYGTANRESWYNDDYYKKYGDLVRPAQKDIREAIQLCAKECSKGRYLEEWEVTAILSYYYSISYKMKDLGFSEADMKELNETKKNTNEHANLIAFIKSKYSLKSPAH